MHNKNLLFYSLHPNDVLSRQCLDELAKMPELSKQFVPICIHHPRDCNAPPNIRLPKTVQLCKQRGLIPLIAAAGFNEPVFAQAALSLIKQSALKQTGVVASNIHGQGTADNCCSIEQASRSGNTLFDTDYNIGFSSGKGEFNKDYASIAEACESKIVTYDDANDRKSAASEIAQRLEGLKMSRDVDVPQSMPGRPPASGMPQMPSMNRPMPQTNNMPPIPHMQAQGMGMPQMSRGPPSAPMGMPQMPMQNQPNIPMMPMQQQYQQHQQMGMPMMPQMPQQHQQHQQRHRGQRY